MEGHLARRRLAGEGAPTSTKCNNTLTEGDITVRDMLDNEFGMVFYNFKVNNYFNFNFNLLAGSFML